MSLFVVDVESDGKFPETITGYSMVCFGAIKVDDSLDKTFYGQTKPISDLFDKAALSISGFTRKEHELFDDPTDVMNKFYQWIKNNSKGMAVFITDNPAYDFAWINYYFYKFTEHENPFGYSARRIGDLYCGLVKDAWAKWKHLRKTRHTHNPVDDARGNAEVIIEMQKMGIKNLF